MGSSSSSPIIIGTLNGNVVFFAKDQLGDAPYKLWIESPNGAIELLPAYSSLQDFVSLGIISNGVDELFIFSANGQIWSSKGIDGDNPISLGSFSFEKLNQFDPNPLVGYRGQSFDNILILANEERNSLFRTDGTPQGSYELHGLGSFDGNLTRIDDYQIDQGFVFTTSSLDSNNNKQYQSWYSDGVTSSSLKIISGGEILVNEASGVFVEGVSDDGSIVWFTDSSARLWVGDPDLDPNSFSLVGNSANSDGNSAVLGNKFIYNSGATGPNGEEYGGNELWISDGTLEGTKILKDIQNDTGYGYGEPEGLVRVGQTIVYGGADQFHGYELWATDGTEEGTNLLKDINSAEGTYLFNAGGSFPFPDGGIINDGYLYFLAYQSNYSGTGTRNIWRTDGSQANTELVLDASFFTNKGWSSTGELFASDVSLYFTAQNDEYGQEVWKIDFADIGEIADSSQYTFVAPSNATDVSIEGTSFVNADGNLLDNSVAGNSLDNTINPGDGDDIVLAGSGSDSIIGGSGEGDDFYDGGEDIDTVIYTSTTLGVSVNLQEGSAIGSETDTDTLVSIENITFGLGENHFWGNSESNYVIGTMGDNDTAHFSESFSFYEVLKKGPLDNHYFIDNDDFVDIEYFDFNGDLYRHDSSTSSLVLAVQEEIVLFADDFESSSTFTSQWLLNPANGWARSSRRSISGSSSAELNGRVSNGSMVSDVINLSGISDPRLDFSWRIQRNLDIGEFVALDLSKDGENWKEGIAILRGSQDQENTWIEESIDLSDWVGGDLQFRFRGSMSGQRERVNVDDVVLSGFSSGSRAEFNIVAVNESQAEDVGTPLTFSVSRSGDPNQISSVQWSLTGDGANPASSDDFVGAGFPGGLLSFAAGETTKIINVDVVADSESESDEGFRVALSNPVNGSIATDSVTGLIVNDDLVLFSEDFETAGTFSDQWTLSPANGWKRSSRRATGGSWSGEINGRIENGSMQSNPIDLTYVSSAEMTFNWRIQRNLDPGEFIALDLSNDGETWKEGVAILRGNQDQENSWIEESIDLNDWVGGEVQARFRGSMSASKERVNVDDILITGSLIQESNPLF